MQFLDSARGWLGTLGTVLVAAKLLSVCDWLRIHFLCRNDLTCYRARQGGWALVTGASAGIGEAFAWELARRGMNVVIVARSTKTLETLAAQLKEECSVEVLVVTADAAQGESAVDYIMKKLQGEGVDKHLTMLINNVGVEFGDPCPLLLKHTADMDGMIDINVRFSSLITARCLPLLLAAGEARRTGEPLRAACVNVASTAANATPPLLAVYSGTKAYNRAFSTSLASEMRTHYPSSRVDVLSVRASFVETRMSGLKANCLKGYMMQVVMPSSFVKSCLDKLSFVDDISPHWAHDLQTLFMGSLPRLMSENFLHSRVGARYEANLRRDEETKKGK
mmetsp:Transcript_29681/g.50093  ORF Transcript_29681/g.50093 Transcript_29681/m.50093 type:complete len:336 (-) Transcript_29681:221-1228(-)